MTAKPMFIKEFLELPSGQQRYPETLARLATWQLEELLEHPGLAPDLYAALRNEHDSRPDKSVLPHSPSSAKKESHAVESGETEKSYPGLGMITGLFRMIGWLIIGGGVILAIIQLSKDLVPIGIGIGIVAVFLGMLAFALAESIQVIIDIYSTNFRILQELKKGR